MIAQFARMLVPAAVSMVVGLSLQSAHAAPSDTRPAGMTARTHDVFTEGLRQGAFHPYLEGARGHDVFSEGLRQARFDVYTEGAHGNGTVALVAGLDRSGVSAPPARQFNPYLDGARTVEGDPRARGAALAGASAWV